MTLRPGDDWGESGPLPPGGVVVGSDLEARRVVEAARRAGEEIPPLGLVGGDLGRALGAGTDPARLQRADATRVRIDIGKAVLDGGEHWFVAHLLVRRRGWLVGPLIAVMNTEWLGSWRVAPRAHPGDGRLDEVQAVLGWRDRLAAWRRLPSGDHLPHPEVSYRATAAVREYGFERPTPVYLDGERVGRARSLTVRIEPGALLVVV